MPVAQASQCLFASADAIGPPAFEVGALKPPGAWRRKERQMDKTGTNPLADIPESVVDAVSRALRRLADLERQRAGYKRMGLGDRFDADLDAAGAFARDTVTEFRSCAAANGVDADAAIAAMGGAS